MHMENAEEKGYPKCKMLNQTKYINMSYIVMTYSLHLGHESK